MLIDTLHYSRWPQHTFSSKNIDLMLKVWTINIHMAYFVILWDSWCILILIICRWTFWDQIIDTWSAACCQVILLWLRTSHHPCESWCSLSSSGIGRKHDHLASDNQCLADACLFPIGVTEKCQPSVIWALVDNPPMTIQGYFYWLTM